MRACLVQNFAYSRVFLKELVKEEKKHKHKILEAMRDPKKVKEIGSFETKIQDLSVVARPH